MRWERGGPGATRIAAAVVGFGWWMGVVLGDMLVLSLLAAPVLSRWGLVPWFGSSRFQVDARGGPPRVAADVTIAGDTGAVVQAVHARGDAVTSPVLRRGTSLTLDVGVTKWWLFYVSAAPLAAAVAAALWAIWLVRTFLRDVLNEHVFTERNAARLTIVGWILLVSGVAGPVILEWRTMIVLRQISDDGVRLVPANVGAGALWVAGLLLLALSSAWRYGVELQRDRELTV